MSWILLAVCIISSSVGIKRDCFLYSKPYYQRVEARPMMKVE